MVTPLWTGRICSHWWPELPGNGRSILTVTLNSGMTMTAAAMVLALKPLLTALFLRAGAVGGMLTPSLATGAAAGSLLVLATNASFGTSVPTAAISLAGAAGVLAITQRTPFWVAMFVWNSLVRRCGCSPYSCRQHSAPTDSDCSSKGVEPQPLRHDRP